MSSPAQHHLQQQLQLQQQQQQQHHHHHRQHQAQQQLPSWQFTDPFASAPPRQSARMSMSKESPMHIASVMSSSSADSSSRTTPIGNRRRLSSTLSDDASNVKLTRTGRPSKALKGQAVHTCEDCGKVYTRAEHMRRHQRTHSQGLVCDVAGCERTFNRTDMLQRHKEKHHSSRAGSRRQSASSQGSRGSISRSPVISAHAQQPFPAMQAPFAGPQAQAFEVHGIFNPALPAASAAVMPTSSAADQWASLALSSSAMSFPSASNLDASTSEPYPGGYSYSMHGSSTDDSWYSPGLSSIASPSLNSSSMPSAWGSTTSLSGQNNSWDQPLSTTPFGTLDPIFDALPAPMHPTGNPQGSRQRDFDLFTLDPNGGRESRFLLDSYFDQCIESF